MLTRFLTRRQLTRFWKNSLVSLLTCCLCSFFKCRQRCWLLHEFENLYETTYIPGRNGWQQRYADHQVDTALEAPKPILRSLTFIKQQYVQNYPFSVSLSVFLLLQPRKIIPISTRTLSFTSLNMSWMTCSKSDFVA